MGLKQFILDSGMGLVHILTFSSCEFKCDQSFDLEKTVSSNLEKVVSSQSGIQGAACVWLTAFSKTYSEN